MRRIQVRNANIARIANTASRMRWSPRVIHDKIPRATYAANASNNRFTLNWCTGKDSNLRTSLGGTDLQSVGFNHSPTCARNADPPAHPSPESGHHSRASAKALPRPSDTNRRTVSVRRNGSANRHLEVLYGVLLEKNYAATAPRNTCVSGNCYLELAKGFEPLTL